MLNYLLIVLLTFLTRPYIRHEKKKQLEQVDILHTFFGRINWATHTLAYYHMHIHMH